MPQEPSTKDDKVRYTTWTPEKLERLLILKKALDEGRFDEAFEEMFPEKPAEPK
jgi:hypothetical protein